jgi:hypothetical protein
MTTPGQAPAGWYLDPYGHAQQRYYDGTQWTQHVHGAITPPIVPASSTSGRSVAMIVGIVLFVIAVVIIAMIVLLPMLITAAASSG